MRPLIVTEFITLDGVVEAPGGEPTHPHSGWTIPYSTDALYEYKLQETLDATALLLGRVTYQGFSQAWPDETGPFAEKLNAMPKTVVTSTLSDLTWNASPLTGDIAAGVEKLKQGDDGPILVAGSATLVRFLLAQGLVDELRLLVFPVVVGGGLTIWPQDRARLALDLVELVQYESGALLQVYRPATESPEAG
jgi:dihydrofolate reductase